MFMTIAYKRYLILSTYSSTCIFCWECASLWEQYTHTNVRTFTHYTFGPKWFPHLFDTHIFVFVTCITFVVNTLFVHISSYFFSFTRTNITSLPSLLRDFQVTSCYSQFQISMLLMPATVLLSIVVSEKCICNLMLRIRR